MDNQYIYQYIFDVVPTRKGESSKSELTLEKMISTALERHGNFDFAAKIWVSRKDCNEVFTDAASELNVFPKGGVPQGQVWIFDRMKKDVV